MRSFRIVCLVCSVVAVSCSGGSGMSEESIVVTGTSGGVELAVLVADSAAERQEGMSGRDSWGGFDGMLFSWGGDEVESGFWMKGTSLPISIAWFSADGSWIGSADMDPCEAEPCPSFSPGEPYAWALEVPQGDLETIGVGPGATLAVGL